MMELEDRISMVKNVLGMIAGGYTIERILEAYPDLPGALVIIDRVRVRVRPGRQGGQ